MCKQGANIKQLRRKFIEVVREGFDEKVTIEQNSKIVETDIYRLLGREICRREIKRILS